MLSADCLIMGALKLVFVILFFFFFFFGSALETLRV